MSLHRGDKNWPSRHFAPALVAVPTVAPDYLLCAVRSPSTELHFFAARFSEDSDTSNPWKEMTWRDAKDGKTSASKANQAVNKSKAKETKMTRGAATMVGHYESWREAALAARKPKA